MPESSIPFKSEIPQIEIPKEGWKSNIPNHLLHDIDEQTKWLLTEISRNTQATEFACRGLVEISHHLRELNGKTFKNERSAADLKVDVDVLKGQAATYSPFTKPLAIFTAMWGVRYLRWIFVSGLVLIFGLLYPFYVHHPLPIVKDIIDFFGK